VPVCSAARRGFSLLELEVALLVLGFAFAGLFPLAVMHSRGLRSLEQRYAITGEWYVAPSRDEWARKLGAAASLTQEDPGPLPTPPVLLVDDEDADYSDAGGGWLREENPPAYRTVHRRHSPPPPESPTTPETDHAAWLFVDVTPGWYYIQATWLEAPEQATDAHYLFYDGDTLLDEASISQQIAPGGPVYDGRPWQVLATNYIRNGQLRVQLNGQATGDLVADAMRLVPVENDVQVLSLERSLQSEAVTAHVLVDVLVPQ